VSSYAVPAARCGAGVAPQWAARNYDALQQRARAASAPAGHAGACTAYGAATLPDAEQALERFVERWDAKYPAITPSWLADWDRLTVLFDYPPAIRRAIYTTNAIESLNYSLRKVQPPAA
jgi:transposase-like protein